VRIPRRVPLAVPLALALAATVGLTVGSGQQTVPFQGGIPVAPTGLANRPLPDQPELQPQADTRELPEHSAPETPVFSVVDRTTELLPENKNQS